MVVEDAPNPHDSPVFVRGQAEVHGDMVPRSFLELFSGGKREPFKGKDSGRLELAQAIATKNNPLTARVIVNRVWQQHFGTRLVHTASATSAVPAARTPRSSSPSSWTSTASTSRRTRRTPTS